MFRIIFDALPETIFFLNSELFLSKGVSFIVSKYKLPHCVSPVVTLQANTITIQVNVVTISYQIKDILNSEFKKNIVSGKASKIIRNIYNFGSYIFLHSYKY